MGGRTLRERVVNKESLDEPVFVDRVLFVTYCEGDRQVQRISSDFGRHYKIKDIRGKVMFVNYLFDSEEPVGPLNLEGATMRCFDEHLDDIVVIKEGTRIVSRDPDYISYMIAWRTGAIANGLCG
jgi:hypothetical protein